MLAGIAGLVVGCGSSTSGPPLKTYNYGAGSVPTSAQGFAVTAAEDGFQGISSAGSNVADAMNGPTLGDTVASQLNLANGSGLARAPDVSLPAAVKAEPVAAAARSGMAGALRSPALQASCAQVGTNSVTYSNCTYDSNGLNGTLNGTITVNGGTITWDITYTISISTQGVSGNGHFHFSGNVTVTASTIVGSGRSEYVVHASGNGESIEVGQTTGFDANLQYATPFCVTGGTLEVRRSTVVSGSQSGSFDGGVKFTWTGCGAFTVAVGT
jgi:hypothetical protein